MDIKKEKVGQKCHICSEDVSVEDFEIHFLEFHSKEMKKENKRFVCDLCSKSYVKIGGLNFHIKKNHSENEGFKCDICSKSYIQLVSLKYHVKTAHEGERRYGCDQCDIKFNQIGHLTDLSCKIGIYWESGPKGPDF